MCGSMADIQCTTAENREEKRKKKRQIERRKHKTKI